MVQQCHVQWFADPAGEHKDGRVLPKRKASFPLLLRLAAQVLLARVRCIRTAPTEYVIAAYLLVAVRHIAKIWYGEFFIQPDAIMVVMFLRLHCANTITPYLILWTG